MQQSQIGSILINLVNRLQRGGLINLTDPDHADYHFTERDKDLTTFVGRGRLESAEIQDAITEFYRNGPTTNVLWDIRRATIGHLNTDDIHNIRQVIALRAGQRQNGKTAIVTARDLDFGITRMGEAYAQDLPLDFMMFRNLEEAESWLNG